MVTVLDRDENVGFTCGSAGQQNRLIGVQTGSVPRCIYKGFCCTQPGKFMRIFNNPLLCNYVRSTRTWFGRT
jgi:hypothetical protein